MMYPNLDKPELRIQELRNSCIKNNHFILIPQFLNFSTNKTLLRGKNCDHFEHKFILKALRIQTHG